MNTVITLPGWQVVGWTMLYFLAAGTAVALVGAGLRLALRGINPTIRYATSLAVFAVLALLPLGIAGIVSRGVPAPGQRGVPAPVQIRAFNLDPLPVPIELNPEFADSADEQALLPESGTGSSTEPLPAQPVQRRASIASLLTGTVEVLPWVWIVGTPLTFLLLASGLVGAERLRHSSQALDAGPFVETCETLRQALQVTRRVGIAVCERVATPLLVGIVRPLILLPPVALTGWSQDELEMVLLHELAHVRRWDNLVNLVQRVVESLLFFHPAVWVVSRWVRRDREDCCDAVVVAVTAKPQAYAELLLSLTSPPPLAGLATSTPLSEHPVAGRIRRILKLEDEPMLVSRNTLVAVATAVLSLVLTVGLLAPRATDAEESQASRVVPDPDTEESTTENTEDTEEEKSKPLFPTLEEQKAADVAYKLLGVELELLREEELMHLRTRGYKGGLRVYSEDNPPYGLQSGDLLVGLHVWPTENLEQVVHILTRDDLDQLSPLKFYVIRQDFSYGGGEPYGGGGQFQPIQKGQSRLVTGRTSVNLDAWRALPEIQELAADNAGTRKNKQQEPEQPVENKLLYDGKTFDQWKNAWQHDLKTENRIECIKALAAFGRAGMADEAAAAILDVAEQYDFYRIDSSPEGKLKKAVIELLTNNEKSRLPEKTWLPMLVNRLEREPQRYRWLTWNLLSRLNTADAATKNTLLEFQRNSDPSIRQVALQVILQANLPYDSALNKAQPLFSESERKELYREALESDPQMAANLLSNQTASWLNTEELLNLFLNEDESIRVAARSSQILFLFGNQEDEQSARIVEALSAVLHDANRQGVHLEAVRALGTLRDRAQKSEALLNEIIEKTSDEDMLRAALFARERVTAPGFLLPQNLSAKSRELLEKSERGRRYLVDQGFLQREFNHEARKVTRHEYP